VNQTVRPLIIRWYRMYCSTLLSYRERTMDAVAWEKGWGGCYLTRM